MRKELQLIEQIENYILNKMDANEKTAFESELGGNETLQSQVEFQQDFTAAIKRIGLKKKAQKARKKHRLYKALKVGVIVLAVMAVVLAASFYLLPPGEGGFNFGLNAGSETTITSEKAAPIIVDKDDSLAAAPNAFLEQEVFELKTDRDTVIETENGIVVFIPAYAFETKNKEMDFIIQEALNPADIMEAGLNTVTSNGDELETGGMFYLDAYADGERLELKKELIVDVPADPSKNGMELYDGVKNEGGELVWTNPKPIAKPLIPVEITDLDFYPSEYEPKMEDWGYLNKGFKDSLYYSYASEMGGYSSIQMSGNNVPVIYPQHLFMPIAPQESSTDIPVNIDEVIDWNFSVDYSGDIAIITAVVNQRNGWHIYSQTQPNGAIPLPTNIDFNPTNKFLLVGENKEYGAKLIDNEGFPERSFHGRQARFVQQIRIKSLEDFQIKIDYSYMACKTACLPPEFRSTELTIKGLNNLGDVLSDCGVNPAAVKTIWDKTFNNTNLATKEFEERMPWIHKTCKTEILELYINNLNLTLSEVDALAANRLGGSLKVKFLEFSQRGDGKVEVVANAQQKLNAYYKKKRDALQRAITATNANYWREQNKLDNEFRVQQRQSNQRNSMNKWALNKEELVFNTERIYKELGMNKTTPRSNQPIQFQSVNENQRSVANRNVPVQEVAENNVTFSTPFNPSRSFVRANVNRLGWKNIDRLNSVLTTRESARIKGKDGKKAFLVYSDLEISIEEQSNYDQVSVYVIPTTINSYIKLKQVGDSYNYRLNDDLEYTTMIIGSNAEGMHFYQGSIEKGKVSLKLKKTSKRKWKKLIAESYDQLNDLGEELNYMAFAKKDQDRRNTVDAKRNLKNKARPFVFPCNCFDEEIRIVEYFEEETDTVIVANELNNNEQVVEIPQTGPSFPGGTGAMHTWVSQNLDISSVDPTSYSSGTVYVKLTVNADGSVGNVSITQGLTPEIDEIVLQCFKNMPNWSPGSVNGQNVSVEFTLPILINSQ